MEPGITNNLYAVIDIEGTGGRYNEESIIEIAVFLFDGQKVIDQFITLVNPEKPIQPFVEKLTGISNKMVRRAPKFHEVAKRIVKIMEGAIFVAHNVDFDYRILRLEFERLGYPFQSRTLDTIKLTEMLIPGLPAYGLEKVCSELGINNSHRHRADGDALATVELLKILLEKDTKKIISRFSHNRVQEGDYPFAQQTEKLKNATGIYYLFNPKGKIIFIGKSQSLRNEINKHFLPTSIEAQEIQDQIHSLQVEETGSKTLASLKYYVEVLKNKPPFSPLPRKLMNYGIFISEKNKKFSSFKVRKMQKGDTPSLMVSTEEEGLKVLARIAFECEIPLKKFIPSFQYKQAQKLFPPLGAPVQHKRKRAWRSLLKEMIYPEKTFVLLDHGRSAHEKSFIYVENRKVVGYGFFELQSQIDSSEKIAKIMTPIKEDTYIRSLMFQRLQTVSSSDMKSIKNPKE